MASLTSRSCVLPDRHPKGNSTVSNGLALCKLHHAAFDGHILSVRPDLVVEIREDIPREKDGPMLLHGLQGSQILIPTRLAARGKTLIRSA